MSIKEIVGIVGNGLMGMAMIAGCILGLIIHVWSIVIAFSISGLFAAVLTLIFPVLAEIFRFFNVGINASFGTTYCVSIMVYVGLFSVALLGAKPASRGD